MKCEEMNTRKSIALITVVLIVIALVVTGLIIVLGHLSGNPASNQNPSTGTTSSGISIDQAATAVENYLGTMGDSTLGIGSMQEYSNLYYAQVVELNNGTGAFELSVNRTTGLATPMVGPTTMWNTKYGVIRYGMMGYLTNTSGSGMMGGSGMMTWFRGTPTIDMTISMKQAKTVAQQYLDANDTGTTVGQITTFYGFYTMQVLKDSNTVGMMSVYGNNGQVMYYSQMGTFMQQKVFG
jgi:hypothetical protein